MNDVKKSIDGAMVTGVRLFPTAQLRGLFRC